MLKSAVICTFEHFFGKIYTDAVSIFKTYIEIARLYPHLLKSTGTLEKNHLCSFIYPNSLLKFVLTI